MVITLRLNCLRDLQHMTQALVLNNRTLIDFGQPVVLPARQHMANIAFQAALKVGATLDRCQVYWRQELGVFWLSTREHVS